MQAEGSGQERLGAKKGQERLRACVFSCSIKPATMSVPPPMPSYLGPPPCPHVHTLSQIIEDHTETGTWVAQDGSCINYGEVNPETDFFDPEGN